MPEVLANSTSTNVDVWELFRLAGETEEALLLEAVKVRSNFLGGDWREGTTSGTGQVRYSFAACDTIGALQALENVHATKPQIASPRIGFVFPGLGDEATDRLSELAALKGPFRNTMSEADAVVRHELGVTIADLMRTISVSPVSAVARMFRRETPASPAIPPTVYAHASLFTFECALARTWIEWGAEPTFVLGYSLGEYAAACTAGVFSFSDGLRLLIHRARILQALPRSGLLAVTGSIEEIAPHLRSDLYLVAANNPQQTILGGDTATLNDFTQDLRSVGHLVQVLPVEFAFHTPLLADAQAALEDAFAAIKTRPPKYPMISSRTGELVPPEVVRDPRHWARHLCEPIAFRAAVDALLRSGVNIALEVGPGQSLSPMIDGLKPTGQVATIASMPSSYDDRLAGVHLLKAAGQLWASGVPIARPPGLALPRQNRPTSTAPAPAGDLTAAIQRIWAEVLSRTEVGPDDNLFELGANSLITARIALRIKRDLLLDLSVRELFASPSPRQLASVVREGRREQVVLDELLALPNGLRIRYQSRAEALYFYKSIFEDRCYFRHGVTLRPGSVVLDVGANIGMFSICAALEEPTAKIYSFEPVPPLFDILEFNLFDISEEAKAFNIGLSDHAGEAIISYYPENPGMSSFKASLTDERRVLTAILDNSRKAGNTLAGAVLLHGAEDFLAHRLRTETFNVPLKTISQFIRDQAIEAIDLVKIDVQKLEMEVLNGIEVVDWERIRQIVAEVHDIDAHVSQARDMLHAHGFKVVIEQDDLYRDTNIFNLYAIRLSD
jgi:phthiocerol/phenolphthiocerol synthesis type-I polyketide synthase E